MIQNGVTLHENSKRETYAFNAKCSTISKVRFPNKIKGWEAFGVPFRFRQLFVPWAAATTKTKIRAMRPLGSDR